MRRAILVVGTLAAILVLTCAPALAAAPQRFEETRHLTFPAADCGSFMVIADGNGVVQGFFHEDKSGQVVYTYQQLKWEFKYYNSVTGKAAYGSGVFLNFFSGDMTAPLPRHHELSRDHAPLGRRLGRRRADRLQRAEYRP